MVMENIIELTKKDNGEKRGGRHRGAITEEAGPGGDPWAWSLFSRHPETLLCNQSKNQRR